MVIAVNSYDFSLGAKLFIEVLRLILRFQWYSSPFPPGIHNENIFQKHSFRTLFVFNRVIFM